MSTPVNGILKKRSMLAPATPFKLNRYSSFTRDTESDAAQEKYIIIAAAKNEKLSLESLTNAGILHNMIPDNERIWSHFNAYMVYSPDHDVSERIALAAIDTSGSCKGKGICDSVLISTPCLQSNPYCMIKLGRTRTMADPKLRIAPIAALQELGVIEQAIPVSNFFIKIKLAPKVTVESLSRTLSALNRALDDPLFHSIYDGVESYVLGQRAEPLAKHVLILDHPPLSMSLRTVHEWALCQPLADASASWGVGPSGCSLLLEFTPNNVTPPRFIVIRNKQYRISHYVSLPPGYSRLTGFKEDDVEKLLRDCLKGPQSTDLPTTFIDAIKTIKETDPLEESKQPATDQPASPQQRASSPQPAASSNQPAASSKKPAASPKQPAIDPNNSKQAPNSPKQAQQPAENPQQPVASPQQPAESPQHPASSFQKPAESLSMPQPASFEQPASSEVTPVQPESFPEQPAQQHEDVPVEQDDVLMMAKMLANESFTEGKDEEGFQMQKHKKKQRAKAPTPHPPSSFFANHNKKPKANPKTDPPKTPKLNA